MKFLVYIFIFICTAFFVKPSLSIILPHHITETCEHTNTKDADKHASHEGDDSCAQFHCCNCICKCLFCSTEIDFTPKLQIVKYIIKNSDILYPYNTDFWNPPKVS